MKDETQKSDSQKQTFAKLKSKRKKKAKNGKRK